tara:strand:- start:68 stop:385 length:318 start_codon:yes stop_codon:yes gene_type:complete
MVNHTTHINIGPSRAAHVAAKRYLKGKDSPPNATTYCIDVSLTRNLLTKAKKGAARHRWAAIAEARDRSYNEGYIIKAMAAKHAIHSVASHIAKATPDYRWFYLQ